VTRPPRSTRHRSREAALQVLYAIDLARERPANTSGAARPEESFKRPEESFERVEASFEGAEESFERVATHFELPEGARAFAKELVTGVCRLRQDLDARLTAHSQNWRIDRMAAVDRNVLRIAVYEILHSDTPAAVAIDEAVELARRFAGERSPGFVNGILDSVARESGEDDR
jgi:N utilization substance protein B